MTELAWRAKLVGRSARGRHACGGLLGAAMCAGGDGSGAAVKLASRKLSMGFCAVAACRLQLGLWTVEGKAR
jgi:hypothetical protein